MKKMILLPLVAISLHSGGLFSVGHKNFGFSAGASSAFGNDYTVVGASVNYFIADNLSLGAAYHGWFGDDPSITEISIPVTYYVDLESAAFTPYIGGIYRHAFIDEPYEDYNVYGGRFGVAIHTGSNAFMSIGWVQEYYDETIGGDDSRGYPEISAGFTF